MCKIKVSSRDDTFRKLSFNFVVVVSIIMASQKKKIASFTYPKAANKSNLK